MKPFFEQLRRYTDRQMVRPFALAGPVLVLIIALPMLRPLRRAATPTDDEMLRLASVRALLEHQSLALNPSALRIPGAIQTPTGVYSSQPPMMALLLSVPAWLIAKFGISFVDRQVLVAYLLTLIGVTLPVAAAAGLIYRMGRLFELRRPWRAALGFAVVACSGMLSYSVVLNAHAPAAALVIAAAASLIHVAAVNRGEKYSIWFALAGLSAALAAAIDPAAVVFLLLLVCVIPAMRFTRTRRTLGVVLYILGAAPAIWLQVAWNKPITGDILPASLHADLPAQAAPLSQAAAPDPSDDDQTGNQSLWDSLGSNLMWISSAAFGEHGLLSHFPVLIFGILGIAAVMHRHWPNSTKTLAAVTGTAAIAILAAYRIGRFDWDSAMFATRWFIVFTPMLLFWAGAWLRRKHTPLAWGTAAALLAFSLGVGLIGTSDPTPRRSFQGFTAVDALARLTRQPTASSNSPSGISALAGRNP